MLYLARVRREASGMGRFFSWWVRNEQRFGAWASVALAEKVSALLTEEYLKQRAEKGDEARFRKALEKVPDVEPEESDRL
jgi:hypothetical protein